MSAEGELAPRLEVMESLGHYRVVMDSVPNPESGLWKGAGSVSGRRISIRMIGLPQEATALYRHVVQEVMAASIWVTHPTSARVLGHDVSPDGRSLLVVMEPLEGQSLEMRLRSPGIFAPPEALFVALGVADLLQSAHRARVIHGALRPASLLLTPYGVKVCDFGLGEAAWAAGADIDRVAPGARAHLAPERRTASRPSRAGDVLALGSIVLRMLTGLPATRSPMGKAPRVVADSDDPLFLALARACDAALAPDPDERPSMEELAGLLRSAAVAPATLLLPESPSPAPEPPAPTEPPKAEPEPLVETPAPSGRGRRIEVLVAGVILAVSLLVGGTVALLDGSRDLGRVTDSPVAVSAPPATAPTLAPPSSGVRVPELSGLTALEARERLLAAGLRLASVEPVIGPPGEVVRFDPLPGVAVDPGSPVTIYVGVTPQRFADLQELEG
jgi:hypothetical protein